jgi:hypothetical protein
VEYERDPNKVSFVLQRAEMAERAYEGLTAKVGDVTGLRHIRLLYGKLGAASTKAYTPMVWALAHGRAVNLFFNDYELDVSMEPVVGHPRQFMTEDSRVFFYDLFGEIYTYDESVGDGSQTDEDIDDPQSEDLLGE